jgi:hypothetical protein
MFKGSIVAIVTPFKNGAVDEEKLRELVEFQISSSTAAIVQTVSQLRLTDLAKLSGRDISALGKAAQRIAGDVNSQRLVSEFIGHHAWPEVY